MWLLQVEALMRARALPITTLGSLSKQLFAEDLLLNQANVESDQAVTTYSLLVQGKRLATFADVSETALPNG